MDCSRLVTWRLLCASSLLADGHQGHGCGRHTHRIFPLRLGSKAVPRHCKVTLELVSSRPPVSCSAEESYPTASLKPGFLVLARKMRARDKRFQAAVLSIRYHTERQERCPSLRGLTYTWSDGCVKQYPNE